MKVVILAGGSGTRLWPYSRTSVPKQFLHFGDKHSLLQKTVLRFLSMAILSDIVIVTNQLYVHLINTQLKDIDADVRCQVLVEPEKKNTAPAIALAVSYLLQKGCEKEECVLVASSDHLISPEKVFLDAIPDGIAHAMQGKHVVFGVRPNKPETGYGYIKADRQGDVEQFVEKPDAIKAQEYILSGDYWWNSGIFLFRVDVFMQEMKEHCAAIADLLSEGFKGAIAQFSEMPDISIDYALMEKSKKTAMISLDVSWSDVGSWDSLYDVMDKDENSNVKIGRVCAMDTKNCLILGSKRLISTIGLEDLIIVETEDVLLIGKKGESQKVKQLVEELKKSNAKEPFEHVTSHRPWGHFTILEEGERYKIKRIVVNPLQKLSLQMHYHRSEHWVVVKGTAKVTIGENEKLIHENESIFVPKASVHRLENPGKVRVELIEVQVGEYVGEDDIVRLEDIYQRA
jgi:mannose-1-phosphate guanylyltransferase / mannose-6-phosphate isomerase